MGVPTSHVGKWEVPTQGVGWENFSHVGVDFPTWEIGGKWELPRGSHVGSGNSHVGAPTWEVGRGFPRGKQCKFPTWEFPLLKWESHFPLSSHVGPTWESHFPPKKNFFSRHLPDLTRITPDLFCVHGWNVLHLYVAKIDDKNDTKWSHILGINDIFKRLFLKIDP